MKIRNAFRREVTLFLLLSLLQQQVAAQDTSFTQTMDYILAPLDKNRIPTGILYERVMPWANIDLYNDAGQNPPPCNFDFFMQAYNELFIAAYNKAGWHQPIKLRNLQRPKLMKSDT